MDFRGQNVAKLVPSSSIARYFPVAITAHEEYFMRKATVASLLILCGSTAAIAHVATGPVDPQTQNWTGNNSTDTTTPTPTPDPTPPVDNNMSAPPTN